MYTFLPVKPVKPVNKDMNYLKQGTPVSQNYEFGIDANRKSFVKAAVTPVARLTPAVLRGDAAPRNEMERGPGGVQRKTCRLQTLDTKYFIFYDCCEVMLCLT